MSRELVTDYRERLQMVKPMRQPACYTLLIITIIIVLTGAITACGQKGPLYLPDKQNEQKTS